MNIKCKTIKHSEDNIGENLYELEFGDAFLDKTQKTPTMKKNKRLDLIKNFCSTKDIH